MKYVSLMVTTVLSDRTLSPPASAVYNTFKCVFVFFVEHNYMLLSVYYITLPTDQLLSTAMIASDA